MCRFKKCRTYGLGVIGEVVESGKYQAIKIHQVILFCTGAACKNKSKGSFRPLELCRKLSHTLALDKRKCNRKNTWFAQNYPLCNLCFSSLYEISEWLPCCSQWDKEAHPVNSNIWGKCLAFLEKEKTMPSCLPRAHSRARDLTETKSLKMMNRVNRCELRELAVPLIYPIYPQLITSRPCDPWNPKAPLWARPSLSGQTKPQLTTISHEMDLDSDRWSRATANRNSTWIKQIKCCLFYTEPRVEGYMPLDTVQLGKELDTSSTTTTTYIEHPPLKFSKLSCTPLLAEELLQAQDQVLAMRSKWEILQMKGVNTHFAILNPVSHPPGRPIASTNEKRSPPWSSTQNCQEDFNIRIPNMRLEMDHAGVSLQCSVNNIMDRKSPSLCKSHDKGNVILVTEDTRKINAVLEADCIQPPCTAKDR